MYIKLGNIETSLTYNERFNDFMIIAGVVPDCQMSYEKPVLVRNRRDLLLWFGENNTEKDFYEELIDRGVSLYLTKPQSQEIDYTSEGYIDLSGYSNYEGGEIPYLLLPEKGSINTIYSTVDRGKFIWLKEDEEDEENDNGYYVLVNNLPQFSSPRSTSTYNRDTLTLCSGQIQFFHPRYSGNLYNPENIPATYSLNCTKDDMVGIDEERKSVVFYFTIDPSECKDGDYIIFPNKHLIYWGDSPNPKLQGYYNSSEEYSEGAINETSIGGLIRGDYVIFNECKNVTGFYESNGIIFEPDFKKSQDIIEKYNVNREDVIKFWSKTLGGEFEKHIKLSLSVTEEEDIYQIEISRFNYNEIFEGTLQELESAIIAQSRLVSCEIIDKTKEPPEGTWNLLGSEFEYYTSGSYKFSIESLKEEEDIFPDFYLIPNPEDYVDGTDDYEKLYLFLLGLTTSQYLIQNNETNYRFNYTKDVDNRLIWFYKNLAYQGQVRDGYYVFLMGILNNVYSVESTDIIYYLTDGIEDVDEEELKISLQNYKSNYLTDNEHKCFYKNYQNGKKFNTTILMRFCIGKVRRELEKNKWNFLGKKLVLTTTSNEIVKILDFVRERFYGIIRSIRLEDQSSSENTLNLTISTIMSDLPKNDLILDIKINYIK